MFASNKYKKTYENNTWLYATYDNGNNNRV